MVRNPRRIRGADRGASGKSSGLADLPPDLADRLLLELPDALARQVVLVADLLQRELVLVVEAEPPADDPRLDRRGEPEEAPPLARSA